MTSSVFNRISGHKPAVGVGAGIGAEEIGNDSFESFAWHDHLSLELIQLESLSREYEKASDLLYSVEALSTGFFQQDTVTEYEAHLYQLSVESVLITAGFNVPVELAVPSFEEAAAAQHKEKSVEKSDNIIKRVLAWLGDLLRKVVERFKAIWAKFKGSDANVKKQVETLKSKFEMAHKGLTHDKDGEKGNFNVSGIKEKDAGKHGTTDTGASAKKDEPKEPEAKKEDNRPVMPKTVKINEKYLRTFTGGNGKPVELHGHLNTTLEGEEKAIKEMYDGVILPLLGLGKDLRAEGPKPEGSASVADGNVARATKEVISKIGLGGGKRDFVVSPCAKVTLVNETRNSGIKLKIRKEYAFAGTLAGEAPTMSYAEVNKLLGLFDKYDTSTSTVSSNKIIAKLEAAANDFSEMSKTFKGQGDKATSEKLKNIGAVISGCVELPVVVHQVRYDAVVGVLHYLFTLLQLTSSHKFE